MDITTIPTEVIVALIVGALTASVTLAVKRFWRHRRSIWAAVGWWVPVRGVVLYLSERRDYWNIEVPNGRIADVKWRLRDYNLRDTDFISSIDADEHSKAFRFRIAAYDQSFADDIVDISAEFAKRRIVFAVTGDATGPHSNREIEASS